MHGETMMTTHPDPAQDTGTAHWHTHGAGTCREAVAADVGRPDAARPDAARPEIFGHPLPPLLAELMARGRWRNPGDEVILDAVPFLEGPVDFLATLGSMRCESSGLLADHPRSATFFHEVRGSRTEGEVQLPWLDADKAVFIAVNLEHGDYAGIALDYRPSEAAPRVVASQWLPDGKGCVWRPVAETFDQFARAIGLAAA